MIPLGGDPHLVVHNEVHRATDIKVGQGGHTKGLCHNPLPSERHVSMHQKIQDLHIDKWKRQNCDEAKQRSDQLTLKLRILKVCNQPTCLHCRDYG